jgi:eukaryotic-like serine/threonine-protein kinase
MRGHGSGTGAPLLRTLADVNLIGQQIGSYIVERELGSGGTGAVYVCKHTLIDREVAVKVLHDEHARDPDQVARFFQEAKAAADIGHPNVIVIIDYGSIPTPEGSRTYLMMESLDGESLDKRMARGGMTLEDIAHILTQIVSALIACHAKGVIHRDLKPSNIFLCNRSFDPMFVKVLDFGTAKLAAPAHGVRQTQYGVVIGTPPYMSPEQCEGKGAIDHRTDIYSLGVMLYEMLTGTLPFQGELGEILIGHLRRTPEPVTQRNPAVPPEWEALCARMMEKSRDARFQSMVDVAHALDDLREHAAQYQAFRAEREALGHSPTMVAPVTGVESAGHPATLGPSPLMAPMSTPAPIGTPTPMPTPLDVPAPMLVAPRFDPTQTYVALVHEPSFAAFASALMLRPSARWLLVSELASAAGVAIPGVVIPDVQVTWLNHPTDQDLAVILFLSISTGWRTVAICRRPRW